MFIVATTRTTRKQNVLKGITYAQNVRKLTILKKHVVTERKMLLARQLLSRKAKKTLKIQAKQMWKRTLIDMRPLLTTLMSAVCECVWSEDLIPKSFNHISKTLTIPRS